ncbi:MAG: heavy metal translocating P-type ATPase metal-binding domain-containing protein [Anaerolineales bacterium]|nr:heavy metal translocating P-type ATPase metal-binding domain-containing protein [Anaerolineales bacterium]
MVDTIKCDHCGAMANAKYNITKEFDGKILNFCCRGCLQVYELLREDKSNQPPDPEKPESPPSH